MFAYTANARNSVNFCSDFEDDYVVCFNKGSKILDEILVKRRDLCIVSNLTKLCEDFGSLNLRPLLLGVCYLILAYYFYTF